MALFVIIAVPFATTVTLRSVAVAAIIAPIFKTPTITSVLGINRVTVILPTNFAAVFADEATFIEAIIAARFAVGVVACVVLFNDFTAVYTSGEFIIEAISAVPFAVYFTHFAFVVDSAAFFANVFAFVQSNFVVV